MKIDSLPNALLPHFPDYSFYFFPHIYSFFYSSVSLIYARYNHENMHEAYKNTKFSQNLLL